MEVVGVDGCRAGWLAIRLARTGEWEAAVFPVFARLWEHHRRAQLILVDIPIGLRDKGPAARRCDQEARRILGPRRSSVFPVPCRAAIYQADYDAAIRENLRFTGKSIFRAVWQIAVRIREVDELLRKEEAARRCVRESHPEVCFWALNGGRPLAHNKRTEAGAAERRGLLTEVLPRLHPRFAAILDRSPAFMGREATPDDFLDALALAATAWVGLTRGLSTLPPDPEVDTCGLPMEMVYVKWGQA